MELQVARHDLRTTRLADDGWPPAEPGPGEALLFIDRFALTANNITYAVFGDLMGYWKFFPSEAGWGRIPVWGFATVGESNVAGLVADDRVYGFFPMATHLIVQPEHVGDSGFTDGAPHRAGLPAVYNHYLRIAPPAVGDPPPEAGEAFAALFRPLFTTSFLIDDFLDDHAFFGATQVVIGSASSKTALGLAQILSTTRDCRVIGLTSAANVEFVTRAGYYDAVVPYGALAEEPNDVPTVFVDMAGDGAVLVEVHEHFAGRLAHSCRVGATHWEELALDATVPGPEPAMFFAPDRVEQRRQDWGPGGVEERVGAALAGFIESARGWMEVVEHKDADAVTAAYLDVLEGRARPDEGIICSFFDRITVPVDSIRVDYR